MSGRSEKNRGNKPDIGRLRNFHLVLQVWAKSSRMQTPETDATGALGTLAAPSASHICFKYSRCAEHLSLSRRCMGWPVDTRRLPVHPGDSCAGTQATA